MIRNPHRVIAFWLFSCCALVFLMVMIGAITRLTGSGLSIAEWNPLMGAIPPLNEAEWSRLFDLYRQGPEFREVNSGMDMAGFKTIFFWEWAHRFLGRLIGIVYALPLAFFWVKGWLVKKEKIILLGVLLLGALQGFIGWFMVQSGLADFPAVSHYRLAMHLALALLIYALMFWMGLFFSGHEKAPHRPFFIHARIMLVILVLTMLWGAYVAGLDGGQVYNYSFPLMGSGFIPPEVLNQDPMWKNFFEDPAGVQFIHRWLAALALLTGLSLWGHGVHIRKTFPALHMFGGVIMLQFALGIATLFSAASLLPATLHQAGAVTLLTLLLVCLYRLKSP